MWLWYIAFVYLYVLGGTVLYAFVTDHRVLLKSGEGWQNWITWYRPKFDREDGIRPSGYVIIVLWPLSAAVIIVAQLVMAFGRWLESKGL